MGKILLIIKREYLVRVRKKSFLIMTILGPLLMGALMVIPAYLTLNSQTERLIAISDKNYDISTKLKDSEFLHFTIIPDSESELLRKDFSESPYYALLTLENDSFILYSNQQISLNVSAEIKNQLEEIIEKEKFKEVGIDLNILEEIKTSINIITKIITEDGKSSSSKTELIMIIGSISGILIYIFIFMYGTMVMRGVIEEKTNRIIEVIISSIKPFQLMMGKIIGVAMVGLTQFILWIILTMILLSVAELFFMDANSITNGLNNQEKSLMITEITNLTNNINLIQILFSFLFYFLAGYLLYSSLFAAVGSAVDAEADTQQFILPVTIPLILAFILIQPIMDNPDGNLSFWMSIIPFTSPIVMMVRLPFGVPIWEILLSMFILIITFILTTWIAAKIYRVGILMYGKKATYKELLKWISYKA
jgi:ABC-2 type transport system permease protein